MRKIICRFDDQASVDKISELLIGFDNSVLEYDLDTLSPIKIKKGDSKKRPTIDKHECEKYFKGFPEYKSKKIEAFHKVVFHTQEMNEEEIGELFEQNISEKTKSIWFPKLVPGRSSKYRAIGDGRKNKFPIYVVSKGRPNDCTTSEYLSRMEVEHFVVVEPFEVEIYKESLDPNYCNVIELDMSYKDNYDTFSDLGMVNSTGPGAARNFCWEDSIRRGYKWHWVFDDNANEGFHMLHQNSKIKVRSGEYFRAIEDWVEKFDNIAIAGLNYTKFCMESGKYPPYVTNTRIYSFLLIRNDIDYRWRGRYNEDTDLSLRVLKDGWCTVQFNSFLAGKVTTQKVKGGNTAEFYGKEGTYNKSKMLEDMHPDVAKVAWKFNRWHHQVDYSGYTQKLKPNVDFSKMDRVDDLGMGIFQIEEDTTKLSRRELISKYGDEVRSKNKPTFYTYD